MGVMTLKIKKKMDVVIDVDGTSLPSFYIEYRMRPHYTCLEEEYKYLAQHCPQHLPPASTGVITVLTGCTFIELIEMIGKPETPGVIDEIIVVPYELHKRQRDRTARKQGGK